MTQRFKSSTLRFIVQLNGRNLVSCKTRCKVGSIPTCTVNEREGYKMAMNIFDKNTRKRNLTLQETVEKSLKDEYFKAVDDYKLALQQFNYTDPDYIEVSIINLNLMKENLNNIIRRIKINSGVSLHN